MDTMQRRLAALNLNLGRGVIPGVTHDMAWRMAAGGGYPGHGYIDLSALNNLYVLQDPPSDAANGPVNQPTLWNEDSPLDQFDFSCFTVAADGGGQTHYSGRGATKITDRCALVVDHAKGTGGWWLEPGGTTEHHREWGSNYLKFDGVDMGIVWWDDPLDEITNARILTDCSKAASKSGALVEMGRHLNVQTVNQYLQNGQTEIPISGVEGGDSGKPLLAFWGQQKIPVLLGLCYFLISGGNGLAINVRRHLDVIEDKVTDLGESLSMLTTP